MLVRFLMRSFVNGRLVDAGEEVGVPDDMPMHAHMVDVATGKSGPMPHPMPPHVPMFLDHSGDSRRDSSKSGYYNPALADGTG
jgi:hypothetical protein